MKKLRLVPVLALSVLGLGFAGYSAYWFHAAGKLRQAVLDEAASRRAEGYDFAWESYEIGGYPAAFRLEFSHPSLSRTAGAVPWKIQAEQLTAWSRPWTPLNWEMNSRGIVTQSGPQSGVEARIETAKATILLPLRPPATHQDPAITADAVLSRLTLQKAAPGLGAGIAAVSLSLAVKGSVAKNLTVWRDDGGTVELQQFEIDWGPLSAKIAGTLALDEKMQPMGALTASVKGYGAAIDALQAEAAMRPNEAMLAKFALGALSKPDTDGKPRVEAPVTLQNGYVYFGPAKLARLPEFNWH